MDIKIPPSAIDIEKSVLGSLFINNDRIVEIMDILSPDDFSEDKHRVLYEIIATLFTEGKSVDILTVSEKLGVLDYLEKMGGVSYLTSLINEVPTASHVLYYAKIVRSKSKLRKIISKSHELAQEAQGEREDKLPEIISEIEHEINGLKDVSSTHVVEVQPLLVKLSEEIMDFKTGRRESISTGFAGLDKVVDGFIVPHVWIIGGYTGQGKTFFTLCLLLNFMRNGMKPILFSTENSATRNILRLIGCITGLSEMKIYKGKFTDEEKVLIDEAKEELANYPLIVYDSVFDTNEIRLKAKKHKIKHGSNLIVVDYIQNLNTDRGEIYQQMSNVAMELQKISIELNMGVIGVSQISNNEASKSDTQLLQFKGAGEISAVADVAIWLRRNKKVIHKLVADIKKVRHGTTGYVMFDFFEKDPEGKIIKYLKESTDQTYDNKRV